MLNKIKILAVIPARYASSRLPGKLLMTLGTRSILETVYFQVKKCLELDRVIIATDDQRIVNHVNDFGGDVMMTSQKHRSGTERCIEVFKKTVDKFKFDYLINIQGDEPFLKAEEIVQLIELMVSSEADIGTLGYPITNIKDLKNPNVVKLVKSTSNHALYFSRSAIPFHSKADIENNRINAIQHIGLYAFHKDAVAKINNLPSSALEKIERLEQLRWMEYDMKIVVGDALNAHIGIDTMEDLEIARQLLNKE